MADSASDLLSGLAGRIVACGSLIELARGEIALRVRCSSKIERSLDDLEAAQSTLQDIVNVLRGHGVALAPDVTRTASTIERFVKSMTKIEHAGRAWRRHARREQKRRRAAT
jgi:hypothetical protein